MTNYVLFDHLVRGNFLPLTYLLPLGKLRLGILTIKEKWYNFLPGIYSFTVEKYLSERYRTKWSNDNILINSSVLPESFLAKTIQNLAQGEILKSGSLVIAARLDQDSAIEWLSTGNSSQLCIKSFMGDKVRSLARPEDFISLNRKEIENDYSLLKERSWRNQREEAHEDHFDGDIYIHPTAEISRGVILNAQDGPIYIGENANIMEGSLIRGPLAMCNGSVLKMGTKIYGGTTIGSYARVGGEVKNSLIGDYSNKTHEGYLGDSYIGRWCNLGALTSCSNMKNTYGPVKIWDIAEEKMRNTGHQFCGLIMGDYTRSAIHTRFTTGSLTGIFCNILTECPPKYVPSFSWGKDECCHEEKVDLIVRRAYEMRGMEVTQEELYILNYLYNHLL